MNTYSLINYLLILAFVVLCVIYLVFYIREKKQCPPAWKEAVKSGKISPELFMIEKQVRDRTRFFQFWLQTGRLKNERITGAFAELGVYQGESARVLHHLDPTRKFYLLDTFEGFTDRDLEHETGEAATYSILNFADTSVEKVLKKVGGNNNLIVCKGFFPDTSGILEGEEFALVNIDADLYQPTKAGLEFFYPRLSPGGIIFIHDYNHSWSGVKKAVDEFLLRIPEVPVLLTDKDSSIVIVKSRKKII